MGTSEIKNSFSQISKNDFNFIKVIGRGSYGKVWKVEHKQLKMKFAIKVMSKLRIIDTRSVDNIINEKDILSRINGNFIPNLYCTFQDQNNLYLVLTLLQGKDLRHFITKIKHFSEPQIKFIIGCLVQALTFLKLNNVVHRDIKPENIVLDSSGYFRVTDFGLASFVDGNAPLTSESCGTLEYMSPEILNQKPYSFQTDVYSFGILLYELIMGYRPYFSNTRVELQEKMSKKQITVCSPQIPKTFTKKEDVAAFLNLLLQFDVNKRISCDKIKRLKNDWLKEIDWERISDQSLESPFIEFIDKEDENSNLLELNNEELIGCETMERYKAIISDLDYDKPFNNFNYINHKLIENKKKVPPEKRIRIPTVISEEKPSLIKTTDKPNIVPIVNPVSSSQESKKKNLSRSIDSNINNKFLITSSPKKESEMRFVKLKLRRCPHKSSKESISNFEETSQSQKPETSIGKRIFSGRNGFLRAEFGTKNCYKVKNLKYFNVSQEKKTGSMTKKKSKYESQKMLMTASVISLPKIEDQTVNLQLKSNHGLHSGISLGNFKVLGSLKKRDIGWKKKRNVSQYSCDINATPLQQTLENSPPKRLVRPVPKKKYKISNNSTKKNLLFCDFRATKKKTIC